MRGLASFLAGFLFALGLGVGGMTRPAKVIGFLDITGGWDPSLALVMGGALAVFGTAYALSRRLDRPWFAERFALPTRTDLDGRLVGGAALFGVGWGLAGYCPGPAVVSAVTGSISVLTFVGSMCAGLLAARALDRAPVPQVTR